MIGNSSGQWPTKWRSALDAAEPPPAIQPGWRKKWLAVFTGAAVLFFTAGSAARTSQKRAKPLNRQEVSQVWVGFSEDELLFLRLDLNYDGTGLGCYLSISEEGNPFRITSWTYESPSIDFHFAAANGDKPYFQRLSGRIIGRAMDLTMSGDRWESRISLRRESDLVPKWQRVRSIMDAMKAKASLPR
jgi:hypothetical protein